MARARSEGNGKLEAALEQLSQTTALLNQNQIAMTQNMTAFLARASETDRILADTNRRNEERFARIEAKLDEHSRVLAHVLRLLEGLPEAVRDKIGFKAPGES